MMKLALAAARATAFASRASGRGGGTTLPGPRAHRAGAGRAATPGRAAAARLRARLGHERQDHHVRPARGGAARPRAARAQQRGRQPRLRHRLGARRARGRDARSSACSSATRRRFRRSPPSSIRARSRSATSSATSSTATASSSSWRPAGATSIADLPPATTLVVAADDPLTASLVEEHPTVVRYGIDDPSVALAAAPHAADARFCVRCGHAYDYRATYVGHLSDYSCPNCGNARAPLDLAARAIELRGLDGTAFDLCRGRRARARRARAARPLQRRERARGGRAGGRPGRAARASSPRGSARFHGAFGRFQRLRVGSAELVLLLIKNPAGANEVLRILPGRRRVDAVRAQRPHRRRPRRLVGLGRRLGGRRAAPAPRRRARARAPAMPRCGSSTRASIRPRSRSSRTSRRRSTASPSCRPAAPATCCRPTRRCSSCSASPPAAASRGRTGRRRRHEARALPAVSRAPLDLRRPRQRPGHPAAARVARARARGAAAARRRGARPRRPPTST